MGSEMQGLCQVSASGLVLGSQASPYQSYLDDHSTPNTTFIFRGFVDLVFSLTFPFGLPFTPSSTAISHNTARRLFLLLHF